MEEIKPTGITSLHADILETHILTRLDGPSLASLSCTSPTLNSIASQSHLWSHLFRSTWPSIATSPILHHLISTFPDDGPRSFFSLCHSLPPSTTTSSIVNTVSPIKQLISAVDIQFHNDIILSKVQETETVSGWFKCSPFRIDLLDPKETITTRIPHVDDDNTCDNFLTNMRLSWILIDPTRPSHVMNMSSFSPVSATRHWLSKEVQVRFATVLGSKNEMVQCEIVVTCGGSENGEMQVREVSLEMEDMEGMHLNGKDSMVILEKVMLVKRIRKGKGREEEAKRRYREYVEKKKERREKKIKREGMLDMLSIAFAAGSLVFTAFWFFLL